MALMLGGCSVLQRMLRRNPLAALSLQQPSIRTPSLQLADDMPFQLDKEGEPDSPDGACMQPPPPLPMLFAWRKVFTIFARLP